MASEEDIKSFKNEQTSPSKDQEAVVEVKRNTTHRKLFIGLIITGLALIIAVIPITIMAYRNESPGEQSGLGQSTDNPLRTENSTFASTISVTTTRTTSGIPVVSTNSPTSRPPIIISTTREPTVGDPTQPSTCNQIAGYQRFDCFPDVVKRSQSGCIARGCCWNPISEPKNAPSCYYPPNYTTYYGQQVQNVSFGQRVIVNRRLDQPALYHSPAISLRVDIQHQTASRLRIKITDRNSARYQVPIQQFPDMKESDQGNRNPLYHVQVNTNPFSIKITRKSTGQVIMDTSVGGFIYEDQFLQISSKLSSTWLYGLGEHERQNYRHQDWNWHRWGMFASDNMPDANQNLYGVHPMYLNIEDNVGNAHAVLLINSNALEAVLTPSPGLTWRTIGGILDFIVFLGPSPQDVINQYIKTIGLPYFPPYWALGFQLSRWGYNSLDRVKEVVKEMKDAGIPQDVQYGDIDYMQDRMDFTYNKESFSGLPEFVRHLHAEGQKYVIVLDPAIRSNRPGFYRPYSEGLTRNIFIRDENGMLIRGQVWPQTTSVYPDFTNSLSHSWWQDQIVNFHKNISFDGLWLDMNEPSNFVSGSISGCPRNNFNNPPYKPAAISGNRIYDKTLCMHGKQTWGDHYNVHNLYGYSQMEPSMKALRAAVKQRGMIISRSTFTGSGRFGGHNLGDNWSGWQSMSNSIIGSLEFNMFGVPYVGANVCGYSGNATASLCNRWMQLGAFYTYSRNHNSYGFGAQHPPALGPENAANAKKVLLTRYSLLPYLYTLFYQAHTQGNTVMRSLMFEFPTDEVARSIDKQFLWGPALLITPVLTENANSVRAYFPQGRWFDYYTGQEINTVNRFVDLPAPTNHINLHIRGGYVLPHQKPANTTFYARKNPYSLKIAVDNNEQASGTAFYDDGESIDTIDKQQYTIINYEATSTGVTASVTVKGYSIVPRLDFITVYGIKASRIISCRLNSRYKLFNWDNDKKVLNVTKLDHDMNTNFILEYGIP